MEFSYQSMKVAHQVREAVSFLLVKVLNRVTVVIGKFRGENTRKALALWEAKLTSAAHHNRASDRLPRDALAFIYLAFCLPLAEHCGGAEIFNGCPKGLQDTILELT